MPDDGTQVIVIIPAPLRRFTNGESKVQANAASITELLENLESAYPGIQERICESDGRIKRFVNIFVNGTNIRTGDGPATTLRAGDEVGIVPAMAGG